MKNFISFFASLMLTVSIFAQSPESFSYQAIVRDNLGQPLPNTSVTFQFNILQTSASGTVVYSEEQTTTTNDFGLVNLKIGEGTVQSGTFSTIDWGNDAYFLNIQIDQGSGFVDMGTQQFISVPYALYAKSAGNGGTTYTAGNGISITGSVIENTEPDQTVIITGGGATTVSGTYPNFTISSTDNVDDADADPNNEIQTLSQVGTNVTLSDGGGTISVADNDNSSSNEIQTLSQTGTNVTLSNSGGTISVADNDNDASNEIQSLSVTGNQLSISGSGGNTVTMQVAAAGNNGDVQFNDNGSFGSNADLNWNNMKENLIIGQDTSDGRLVIRQDPNVPDSIPILEVKNKAGQTIFVVYPDSVHIFIDDDNSKGALKGGFAVSGRSGTKALTDDYLLVRPDSTRISFNKSSAKGVMKGGFAVSGRSGTKSGVEEEYFNISPNDTASIINPSEPRIMWYPIKEAFLSGRVLIESPDSVGMNSWATGFESKSIGDYSQALGYSARAFGDNSTAIGYYANAIGDNSYAFGNNATAFNNYSVAMGSSSEASNTYAVSIGYGSTASGYSSFAAGRNTSASNNYSVAMGYNSSASGYASTAISRSANAGGSYSIAFGYSSNSSGNYSTAIGRYASAGGEYSIALGYSTDAPNLRSTAIGYNSTSSGDYAVAIGRDAIASNTNAYSFGNSSDATAQGAYAIGDGAQATGEGAYAIGSLGRDSVGNALGYSTEASGNYSFAIGNGARSTNLGSLSYGSEALSSGLFSNAMGSNSQATGDYSMAFGKDVYANGSYGVAFGQGDTVGGDRSIAIGVNQNVTGNKSIALGNDNKAGGLLGGGVAIGVANDAGGFIGTGYAIGMNNKATAIYISMAFGYENEVNGQNSYAFGQNGEVGNSSSSVSHSTLFNMTDASNSIVSDHIFSVMGAAIGFGTTTPNSKLHVNSSTSQDPLRVQVNGSTQLAVNADGNVSLGFTTPTGTHVLAIMDGTAPSSAISNGVLLYADYASAELRVMDEAGNTTTLSPHNFSLTKKSEPMAWSYFSENENIGYKINVDMLKAVRIIENLSGEQLVFLQNLETNKSIKSNSTNISLVKKVEEQEKIIKDLLKRIEKLEKQK